MAIAIYARQTVEAKDNVSLEAQVQSCKNLVEMMDKNANVLLFKDIEDNNKRTGRVALQKLLKEIEKSFNEAGTDKSEHPSASKKKSKGGFKLHKLLIHWIYGSPIDDTSKRRKQEEQNQKRAKQEADMQSILDKIKKLYEERVYTETNADISEIHNLLDEVERIYRERDADIFVLHTIQSEIEKVYREKNREWPELWRMLKKIESGNVEKVIVYKMENLCPYTLDFFAVYDFMRKHNCSFISVKESFDIANPMYNMLAGLEKNNANKRLLFLAELYREKPTP